MSGFHSRKNGQNNIHQVVLKSHHDTKRYILIFGSLTSTWTQTPISVSRYQQAVNEQRVWIGGILLEVRFRCELALMKLRIPQ